MTANPYQPPKDAPSKPRRPWWQILIGLGCLSFAVIFAVVAALAFLRAYSIGVGPDGERASADFVDALSAPLVGDSIVKGLVATVVGILILQHRPRPVSANPADGANS